MPHATFDRHQYIPLVRHTLYNSKLVDGLGGGGGRRSELMLIMWYTANQIPRKWSGDGNLKSHTAHLYVISAQ